MSQQRPHRRAKGDLNFVFYSDPAQPRVEHPPRASCSGSRLLFVEVRGARARRRQTLQYDRSTRELKSHVMLVTNEKRQRRTGDGTASQPMAVSCIPADLHAGIISDISQQHVDPFNALPVEGTPELHEALRYYFENYPGVTPLVDDDRVCHSNTYERERMQWNRVQFSICSNERASYYILLFAWQLMKDLSGNLRSMTFVTRRYWAWTLQALREDMPIGKTGTSIPESYVAIVTCTCVASSWLGAWQDSRTHLKGMLALINARGGLSTFSPISQRALKWVEYHPHSADLTRPLLPRLPLQALPPELVKLARTAHARTMELLPQSYADSNLAVIFRQLHEVSLGRAGFERVPVASVVDDVEHNILEALAQSKNKATSDMVYLTLLHSTQIYVWGALTTAHRGLPLNGLFVARLMGALNTLGLVDMWRARAPLESLLWALFVGWTAASQLMGDQEGAMASATWLSNMASKTVEALSISEEGGLREVLHSFPWSDHFCLEPCKFLWNTFLHRESLEAA